MTVTAQIDEIRAALTKVKSTAADRTDDALVRTIDLAMSKFSGNGVGEKRLATLALTSLRRNVVS